MAWVAMAGALIELVKGCASVASIVTRFFFWQVAYFAIRHIHIVLVAFALVTILAALNHR